MAGSKKKDGRNAGSAPGSINSDSPSSPAPWRLRFSARILDEHLRDIGHAAFEIARKAITKKLPVDPHQYGDGHRPPLGGIYKLKASHVRIAYHIEEAAHEVWALMIADRNVIWDRHENEILGRLNRMSAQQGARKKR